MAEAHRVKPENIVEQFVHGSGHGGQKINKRSTRVFLRHLPTGIEVRCQKQRSQHLNRVDAYTILIERVAQLNEAEQLVQSWEVHRQRVQKRRRPKAVKEKILREKKQRSEVKKFRKPMH
jgi:protein subunit release factor B